MNTKKLIEIIILLIPILTGYIASAFCQIGKDAGSTLNIRPPAWVFGVVWPILYLSLGFSWIFARRQQQIWADVLYSVLTLLLVLWIVVYGCAKNSKGGVYVLAGIISLLFASFSTGSILSKVLLCPLIGWIFLATFLNVFEVEKKLNLK